MRSTERSNLNAPNRRDRVPTPPPTWPACCLVWSMTLAEALALALARHPDPDTDADVAAAVLRLALTAPPDGAEAIDALEAACRALAERQDADLATLTDSLADTRVELQATASWSARSATLEGEV